MDYVGTLVRGALRPLFRLPGRAAVDLLASWIGNCNVGVVLTSTQYEEGYYTARESIIIASCFSAVSLPFCLVIAAMGAFLVVAADITVLLALVRLVSLLIHHAAAVRTEQYAGEQTHFIIAVWAFALFAKLLHPFPCAARCCLPGWFLWFFPLVTAF